VSEALQPASEAPPGGPWPNLDNTLEELRRLAYFRTGAEDSNGELLPVSDWPMADRPAILAALQIKSANLDNVTLVPKRDRSP
jgi:hypothetical protein